MYRSYIEELKSSSESIQNDEMIKKWSRGNTLEVPTTPPSTSISRRPSLPQHNESEEYLHEIFTDSQLMDPEYFQHLNTHDPKLGEIIGETTDELVKTPRPGLPGFNGRTLDEKIAYLEGQMSLDLLEEGILQDFEHHHESMRPTSPMPDFAFVTPPAVTDTIPELPGLTNSALEKILQEAFATNLALEQIKVKRLDEGGSFQTPLASVKLYWKLDVDEPAPISRVVIKLPKDTIQNQISQGQVTSSTQKEKENRVKILVRTHDNECNIYRVLSSKNDRPVVPMSQIYHSCLTGEGGTSILVMEDFSQLGTTVKFMEGLNINQLHQVFDALADLHAFSITNLTWQSLFPQPDKSMLLDLSTVLDGCAEMCRLQHPDIFPFTKEEISILGNLDDLFERIHTPLEKRDYTPVIVHGDLWYSNILFRYDLYTPSVAGDHLLALIDWQGAHVGNYAEDMIRLLCSSCSTLTRRKHTQNLLRRYYDRLSSKVQFVPFTFDDLQRQFSRLLVNGAVGMLMQTGLMFRGGLMDHHSDDDKRKIIQRTTTALTDAMKLKHQEMRTLGLIHY